ncbi:hypothetical protein A11A3_10641 [Alcanivorax hongdengensis A-11-3]|uniref:Lipoprotein n=1 Tax=Alcanivorax hongdengensis A-11-3 TaxID=1177179 RepID=L0WE74_9GAMM|nr:hypothetical protein [Alcanivorax hongdengensis]EKF74110.1 hypothetical protein A11A3_10641 [Alcanivorax hongdengensis A-11-3]
MQKAKTLMLTALALGLAACNGGEDFGDANLGGCPAGGSCVPSAKGSVLVELQGLQVNNLGYACGTSFAYTSDEETLSEDDGTTIPPYNAVCPEGASSIEFFLGSKTTGDYRLSLGTYLLPKQLTKGAYQITLADMVNAPERVSVELDGSDTTAPVINRLALLEALDTGGDPDDPISISDDTNDYVASNPDTLPENRFDYTDYTAFQTAWQGFLDAVNARDPSVLGAFDPTVSTYQSHLRSGNDRSRAGLYAFTSSQECQFVSSSDSEGCASDADSSKYSYTFTSLVLPDGSILAGGLASRITNATEVVNDFVTLKSGDKIDDVLRLAGDASSNITLSGLGVVTTLDSNGNVSDPASGATDTDASLTGRFLGQTIYNNKEVSADIGSDFHLDYPSTDYEIGDDEKGLTNDTLVGGTVNDFLFRATKTGYVQAVLNSGVMSDVEGDYIVRLYRACIPDESGFDDDSICRVIPNADQEITQDPNPSSTPSTNYADYTACTAFTTDSNGNYVCGAWDTVVDVTKERIRHDELDSSGVDSQGVGEFCVHISSAGLVTTGDDGACPGTTGGLKIGMVTRTFGDADLKSANIFMRLAPGAADESVTPHYNAEIQGRMDLRSAAGDGCKRLFRLSDDSFEAGVRAAWVEGAYLPRKKLIADGDDETDDERYLRFSLANGAVEMYKDDPGCGPLEDN